MDSTKKSKGRKQPDTVVNERVDRCLRYLCMHLPIPSIIDRMRGDGYEETDRQLREDIKKAQKLLDTTTTITYNIEEARAKRVLQYEQLLATQYERNDLKEVRLILSTLDAIQGLTATKSGSITQTNNTLIEKDAINVNNIPIEKQIELLKLSQGITQTISLDKNNMTLLEKGETGATVINEE